MHYVTNLGVVVKELDDVTLADQDRREVRIGLVKDQHAVDALAERLQNLQASDHMFYRRTK